MKAGDVTVRPASSADRGQVVDIETEVFAAEAWSEAVVADELTAPGRSVVVADHGEALVGFAIGRLVDDACDLQRIAVRRPWRRRGIGTAMLQRLRAEVRAAGAQRILLEVSTANEEAMAFYAAEDFVQIDWRPRYYRDGTDALILHAAVDQPVPGGDR